jgi:glutamate---cysteine ligase / carboxylate-amine ligase
MTVTLGLEEELQVVDALTGALVPHDIAQTKNALEDGQGGIACELHKCTIELQTPIATGPDGILASLSSLRDFARKQAARQGQRVLAAGLHPFSQWRSQPVHEDAKRYPHYAHLIDEYGDIARSAMSFGLHVHLGLPDAKHRIPVMNALRSVLPEVLALSANSPFHEGRDTGLANWRHSLLGRYPRMGIPEIWPDEQTYFAHIERLRRLGSLEPDKGMWDDLRLHLRYGTLEVRICDAIYSLDRIWLIVALLQCEAATLAEEAANGTLHAPEPKAWIEENKWRARRHGMNAALIDWTRDEAVPTPVRYERWLARLLPAAVKLGVWPRIELAVAAALSEGTAAEQQRFWRNERGSFEGLVRTLVDATAEPWIAPPSIRRTYRDVYQSPETGQPIRRPEPASSPDVRTG